MRKKSGLHIKVHPELGVTKTKYSTNSHQKNTYYFNSTVGYTDFDYLEKIEQANPEIVVKFTTERCSKKKISVLFALNLAKTTNMTKVLNMST